MKRRPALRVRVPYGTLGEMSFDDELYGSYTQNLGQNVGDFVIQRSDDVFSYQLAVTVDDCEQEITHVIRGADLLSSTPRQIFLARELGHAPPSYLHVPLVVDATGERIAKRTGSLAHVRVLRDSGISRDEILGELAYALRITENADPISPARLASVGNQAELRAGVQDWPAQIPRKSWAPPARWKRI